MQTAISGNVVAKYVIGLKDGIRRCCYNEDWQEYPLGGKDWVPSDDGDGWVDLLATNHPGVLSASPDGLRWEFPPGGAANYLEIMFNKPIDVGILGLGIYLTRIEIGEWRLKGGLGKKDSADLYLNYGGGWKFHSDFFSFGADGLHTGSGWTANFNFSSAPPFFGVQIRFFSPTAGESYLLGQPGYLVIESIESLCVDTPKMGYLSTRYPLTLF